MPGFLERTSVDDKFYRRIRKTAQYKCINKSEAEDIAQDVALSYLENKASKQTVDQAIIDALRGNGLTTSRCGSDALAAPRRQFEGGMGLLDPYENSRSTGCDTDELFDFESLLYGLEKVERAVIVLFFKWGLLEKEIGYCFGISESRISQILSAVQKTISRKEQRQRERFKQGALPQEQIKPKIYGEKAQVLAQVDCKEEKRRSILSFKTSQNTLKPAMGIKKSSLLQSKILCTPQRFLHARVQ